MYRLFLQSLGYARDLDLSELEITLEEEARLDAFKAKYQEVFDKDWDFEKGKIAIAVQQASRVMHELEPDDLRDGRQLARVGHETRRHHARRSSPSAAWS